MMKLLIISATYHTPLKRLNDTILHVTLNTINGVVRKCNSIIFLNRHPCLNGVLGVVCES